MIRTYRDIRYALKRSDRKTASIYVERDGQVTVIVPKTLSDEQIEKVLDEKRRWIYKSLAEWHDLNATRVERQFVNGEGFLYLGRSYRLKLVPKQEQPLLLKDGHFCLRADLRPAAKAVPAFRDFYRDKGLVRINERVSFFKARMDVEPKSVKILDLKHRWASWTPGGNLNFHWKCMMSPAKILDYIVVHELAHLMYPDHSAKFWNEVDKLLPDFVERKEWLRVHGAGMDL
jgi:predicted metal-dependent hydrolase